MISRKEIANMYGVDYRLITKWLKKTGIIDDKDNGKGNRCLLTPMEFEIFKNKVGEPIRR